MQAFDDVLSSLAFRAGEGDARATLDERWTVGGVGHGGFLLAWLVEALRHDLRHTRLLTVSGHFLERIETGDVDVGIHLRREGQRVSSAVGTLSQGGRPHVTSTATFIDSTHAEHALTLLAERPELPDVHSCVELPVRLPGSRQAPIMNEVEVRLPKADAGWLDGAPSGTPRMSGWIRHRGGRELDEASLVLASDLLPPAMRNLGVKRGLPTVQLTVHVRSTPEGAWLMGESSTTAVSPRFVNDVVHLWDGSGALVADAYQLRANPDPATITQAYHYWQRAHLEG